MFQLSNAKWAHAKCKDGIDAAAIIDGADIAGAIDDDYDSAGDETHGEE